MLVFYYYYCVIALCAMCGGQRDKKLAYIMPLNNATLLFLNAMIKMKD